MFWLLLGALLFLFVRNHFDLQGVTRDIQKIARSVRKIVRDLVRTVRHAVRDAKKESTETRKTVREQENPADKAPVTAAAQAEAPREKELLKDLEQQARTAAMLVNVPTISFPEDDPKYDSSKKYMYA